MTPADAVYKVFLVFSVARVLKKRYSSLAIVACVALHRFVMARGWVFRVKAGRASPWEIGQHDCMWYAGVFVVIRFGIVASGLSEHMMIADVDGSLRYSGEMPGSSWRQRPRVYRFVRATEACAAQEIAKQWPQSGSTRSCDAQANLTAGPNRHIHCCV